MTKKTFYIPINKELPLNNELGALRVWKNERDFSDDDYSVQIDLSKFYLMLTAAEQLELMMSLIREFRAKLNHVCQIENSLQQLMDEKWTDD